MFHLSIPNLCSEKPSQLSEASVAEQLAQIESEHNVVFTFNDDADSIEAEGLAPDVKKALTALQPRAAFAAAIKARQPAPAVPRVKVRLAPEVLAKQVYLENYRRWYASMPKMYWPSPEQEALMFSVIEEGWEILFDFAHSVTCRLPDGRLISVNRKGKFESPSIYSPHVPKLVG